MTQEEKTGWRAEKLAYDRVKGMTGEDGRTVEINGVAFVCSAGDRQDTSHARSAEMVRRWNAHEELVTALVWYREQARLCRLVHSGGDVGRQALDADGGNRADVALSKLET